MNPLDLARTNQHTQRHLQSADKADRLYASDYLQDVPMEYRGYWNGQHWAQVQGEGFIPIEPISTGYLKPGDSFVGSLSGRSVFGRWMPR